MWTTCLRRRSSMFSALWKPTWARSSRPWSRLMRGIDEITAPEKVPVRPAKITKVGVGIVGYGTVGRATAEILTSHADEIRQRTGGVSVVVTRICRKTPSASETGVNGIAGGLGWRQGGGATDGGVVAEARGAS